MGCGASNHTSAMEPSSANGTYSRVGTQEAFDPEPNVEDLDAGDDNHNPPALSGTYGLRPPIKEIKAPVAFEVSRDDDPNGGGASIIRSHPPKRFRRLEDEQTNSLSQEEIQRRQAVAEERRRQVLQSRAQSARLSTAKGPRRQQLTPIGAE